MQDSGTICYVFIVPDNVCKKRANPAFLSYVLHFYMENVRNKTETYEKGIKKDPIPKDEAEDSETAELREIWSSADENERRDLLEMARMLKNRRKQNG